MKGNLVMRAELPTRLVVVTCDFLSEGMPSYQAKAILELRDILTDLAWIILIVKRPGTSGVLSFLNL